MPAVDAGPQAYASAPRLQASVSYLHKALGRRRTTGKLGPNIDFLFSDLDRDALEDIRRDRSLFSVVS
jgi:hypothetical protein